MPQIADPSAVAVGFQALGALMLALLTMQLGRTLYFRPARLWSFGWLALSIALAAVAAWIYAQVRLLWAVYLIGEWIFLLLLWAGCKQTAEEGRTLPRASRVWIPIAIIAAAVMVIFSPTFNDLFTLQAAIIAFGVAAAGVALHRMPHEQRATSWRLMEASLALMAVLYAVYVPLYALHEHVRSVPLLEYSSLLDLLAVIFVGFSMILLIAEAERQQLQRTVAELDDARSKAERSLHVDPLTEVLNRYAFHAMQRGDEIATEGSLFGVVSVFDIDNLKNINDQYGHATGDHVIRAAATAIRNRVRAEDLLFRIGGDEFVVILPNFSAEQLQGRLRSMKDGIQAQAESGENILFHLSWGNAEFGAERSLGDAIKQADAKMYESRRNR